MLVSSYPVIVAETKVAYNSSISAILFKAKVRKWSILYNAIVSHMSPYSVNTNSNRDALIPYQSYMLTVYEWWYRIGIGYSTFITKKISYNLCRMNGKESFNKV